MHWTLVGVLISTADTANSYFMCCESDKDEIVIDSIDDNGNNIINDFEKENERSWSRSPT